VRIVGGKLGGRQFDYPSQRAEGMRPTSERVREAIASRLDSLQHIYDARVLDLYAGSGAYGLEMLSRGAQCALFLERDRLAATQLRKTIDAWELADRASVQTCDLQKGRPKLLATLRRHNFAPFSLIFCDPPYASAELALPFLAALSAADCVTSDALCVLECAVKHTPTLVAGLELQSSHDYGDTRILLLRLLPDR